MKSQFLSCAVGLALSAPQFFAADAAATSAPTNNTPFPNTKDRISYALGVNFGQNLKNQGVEANLDLVRKGIEEALAGKPQLNDAQLRDTFNELRTQVTAHMEEKKKQAKAEGEKFLAENAKKPGIEKTASGLQYRIITPGSGNSPSTNDEVTVNYTGKLTDGTVFDSSEKQGHPVKFRANGVIRGWTEALLKMKKGAKWELFIPSELAYGERARPSIPANSTLIFTVELVDFNPVAPPPALPTTSAQPVTSDIIKVPSAEELKKGAKIEVIKPEDVDKEIAKEKARKEAEEKAAASQKK
jgi:FKBP-type peptidyl-prolyl cis-trans isomerase FklB